MRCNIIFRRNLGWDVQLDPDNLKAWENWREDLKKLKGFLSTVFSDNGTNFVRDLWAAVR